MPPRRNDLGDKAVQVLATTFVLLGGVTASIFLIVVNSSTPMQTLLAFAAGCLGAAILLFILRDPDPSLPKRRWFGRFRRKKTTVIHYELRLRTNALSQDPPPSPPTAERIRELAEESQNTWVPSQGTQRPTRNSKSP